MGKWPLNTKWWRQVKWQENIFFYTGVNLDRIKEFIFGLLGYYFWILKKAYWVITEMLQYIGIIISKIGSFIGRRFLIILIRFTYLAART